MGGALIRFPMNSGTYSHTAEDIRRVYVEAYDAGANDTRLLAEKEIEAAIETGMKRAAAIALGTAQAMHMCDNKPKEQLALHIMNRIIEAAESTKPTLKEGE